MTKLFFFIVVFITIAHTSSASIEKKILSNQKILKQNNNQKKQATVKIRLLGTKIVKQTIELDEIEEQISKVKKDINKHKVILYKSKRSLKNLTQQSQQLEEELNTNEEAIVQMMIEQFSSSIALKLATKESVDTLIDQEIYDILLSNSKKEITRINTNYEMIRSSKKLNQQSIKKTKHYISNQENKIKTLNNLKNKQNQIIASLEKKHTIYQNELKKTLKKQHNLSKLLARLNILKQAELSKEKKAREKKKREMLAQQKKREKKSSENNTTLSSNTQSYRKEPNIDVRILGSSTKGIKIARYRGKKTIAPLKSYKIIKQFGKYYDPVYKIKLFNESVVLKANQSKAKVYNVLNGKVVYAKKDSGLLENVVIIQHQNGLHTIYSHLDRISPTLKVGKWIKKGYVVGRVNQTLTFQATKNSTHINPKDLF